LLNTIFVGPTSM